MERLCIAAVALIASLLPAAALAQARGAAPAQAGTQSQSGVVSAGTGNPYQRAGQLEARILGFSVQPAIVQAGQPVTLPWGTENPSGVTIEPGVGTVTARGSRSVTPTATTTYTLTVRSANNTVLTRAVTVNVNGTVPPAVRAAAAAAGAVPRMADGKPDLTGVYGGGGGGARGAAPAAEPQPGALPRTPTLKPGAESFRVVRGPEDTGRTADCMPLIPSASFGVPYQFQIVQHKDYVVLMHEYPGTFRIIVTDGEPLNVEDDPAWLGHSSGRRVGDTLVVETKGFNDRTEINGYRHSEALRTVERISRPTRDTLQYEITFEDPNVFVGPWTESRAFRLFPQLRKIGEFVCENNRDYRPLFAR